MEYGGKHGVCSPCFEVDGDVASMAIKAFGVCATSERTVRSTRLSSSRRVQPSCGPSTPSSLVSPVPRRPSPRRYFILGRRRSRPTACFPPGFLAHYMCISARLLHAAVDVTHRGVLRPSNIRCNLCFATTRRLNAHFDAHIGGFFEAVHVQDVVNALLANSSSDMLLLENDAVANHLVP